MDKVLADTLTANLKSADTPQEQINALTLAMIAMVDCQQKTAARVKELVADREAQTNRRIGARWAFGAVVSFCSIVGPVVAIKICKVLGVLF